MSDPYLLGAVVPLTFTVTDLSGNPANATSVTCTVTAPDGTTSNPATANPAVGTYTADYTSAQAGRHVAKLVATGDNAGVVEAVFDVVSLSTALVDLAEVKAYLGDVTATDAQIADAILVEQAAQARRCRTDPYGVDLRGALLRRIARNLAARQVPIAQIGSFDGVALGLRVTTGDPEIDRLEAPYRRWTVR